MDNVYVLGVDRTLEADARVERLVDEHQVKLCRYVRRFVGEREAALDVVQDVSWRHTAFCAPIRLVR